MLPHLPVQRKKKQQRDRDKEKQTKLIDSFLWATIVGQSAIVNVTIVFYKVKK